MSVCEECDLPMSVCSALCLYRRGVQAYNNGNLEAAMDYFETAEELNKEWLDTLKDARNKNIS